MLARGARPDWFLYTWRKASPGDALRAAYRCNSWRCASCRKHESHVMYARIGEATAPLTADGWCFFVLTIDREGTHSGTPWKSADVAFRELSRMSRNFLARVRRWQKRQGWRVTRGEWIATVEAHRSGWPHVNVMFWSPMLAASLRADRAEREARGMKGRDLVLAEGELLDHATASGWGVQFTAEAARNANAVASYIVKLAGEAGAVAGELAKLSQLPTMAPERFRRLRAGKGFLPRRRKNSEYTGTLVRRARDHDGTPLVLPLHNVPAEVRPVVVAACYAEESRMVGELSRAAGAVGFEGDAARERGALASSVRLPLPARPVVPVALARVQCGLGRDGRG